MLLRLKELRIKRGFATQEAFAERLGINYFTYRSIEQGRIKLDAERLCSIADLLDCSTDELLGRETRIEYLDPRESELHAVWGQVDDDRRDLLHKVACQFRVAQGNVNVQGTGNAVSTGDVEGNEIIVGSHDSNNVTNITYNFGAAEDGDGALGT